MPKCLLKNISLRNKLNFRPFTWIRCWNSSFDPWPAALLAHLFSILSVYFCYFIRKVFLPTEEKELDCLFALWRHRVRTVHLHSTREALPVMSAVQFIKSLNSISFTINVIEVSRSVTTRGDVSAKRLTRRSTFFCVINNLTNFFNSQYTPPTQTLAEKILLFLNLNLSYNDFWRREISSQSSLNVARK